MYYSKIAEGLLGYISNDVDSDYTIFIDGLYGIAYNGDKSALRLYIVESDIGLVIGRFILDKKAIEDILGDNFFNIPVTDRFRIVSDVLNTYYLEEEGYYPSPFLKSELIKCIESDSSDGDVILIGSTVGIRFNSSKTSVCLYNLTVVEGNINISKKNLRGLDAIYLVLGDDFLAASETMQIEIVLDYFNTLN